MRNSLKNDNLSERPAARAILALALAASLAAFGCTTNRTPGNGEPLSGAPGAGPGAPTSGVSGGTSSGTGNVNPPMTSSSMHNDALPTVNARSRRLPLSADEAAAIMAANNNFRRGVRILGPVNPGSAGRSYASDGVVTGQFQNPAMNLNPIVTVNSSVNSIAHVPAVAAGGGDAGVIADTATLTGAIAGNALVGPAAGTVGDGGGVIFSPATAITTPTAAALPVTTGAFAAGPGSVSGTIPGTTLATTSSGTLTPTVAAGGLPSPTVASSAITASTGTVRAAGTAAANATNLNNATTNATTASNATVASRSTARGATASANVANPVRVTQDANGRVTVTNANSKSQK